MIGKSKTLREQNRGMNLEPQLYSSRYRTALTNWMQATGNEAFEDELLTSGHLNLQAKEIGGLDILIEALAPQEELYFDSNSTRVAPLFPNSQFRKTIRNEHKNQLKLEGHLQVSGLAANELVELEARLSATAYALDSRDWTGEMAGITEPAYAELCRNSPCDLRNSHLRRLREDGYFVSFPDEVQIAAYLLSKGFSAREQIESGFSHLISWEAFNSAQGIVQHQVTKTFPEKFKRLQALIASFSEKQKAAFEALYDVERMPIQKEAAAMIGLPLSSFKDRLATIERKVRRAFPEFKTLRPGHYTKSRKQNRLYNGLYYASDAFFRVATKISATTNSVVQIVVRSIHDETRKPKLKAPRETIIAWAREKSRKAEVKIFAATNFSKRKRPVRGDFFHESDKHKLAKVHARLESLKFTKPEIDDILRANHIATETKSWAQILLESKRSERRGHQQSS